MAYPELLGEKKITGNKKKEKTEVIQISYQSITFHYNVRQELPAEQAKPTQYWAAENADLCSFTEFSHKASPFSPFGLASSLVRERAATLSGPFMPANIFSVLHVCYSP